MNTRQKLKTAVTSILFTDAKSSLAAFPHQHACTPAPPHPDLLLVEPSFSTGYRYLISPLMHVCYIQLCIYSLEIHTLKFLNAKGITLKALIVSKCEFVYMCVRGIPIAARLHTCNSINATFWVCVRVCMISR